MNTDIAVDVFFGQILEAVKAFGGVPWTLKIASIIALVISSMKVSAIRPLWDKLGWVKPFVGSILGLTMGILVLVSQGNITVAGVFAYMFAGAGAIVLHEMLDAIKVIPGIGPSFLSVIDFFQKILKAPKA